MNSIFSEQTASEEQLKSDIAHLEKQIGNTEKQYSKQELQKTLNDRINDLGWLPCAGHRFEEGLSAFLSLSPGTHGESKFAGLSMALMETGRVEEMAGANRHYIPGCAWHITHRCHKGEFSQDSRKED